MSELVARGLALKSVNKDARTVDFIASTDAIDSYDEIVEQDWILDRYLSNPVVLFGHNSRDLPIGTATRCEVVEASGRKQLECTIQFLTAAANPMAEQVWHAVQEGGLRAVSVGFMPGDYRFEKRNGVEVFVLSQNTLHEISVVPIPANPEALAKMKSKARGVVDGNTEKKTMKTIEEYAAALAKSGAELELTQKQLGDASTAKTNAESKLVTLDGAFARLVTCLAVVGISLKAGEPREEQVVKAVEKLGAENAALTEKTIAAEVEALVGVKISPAEKDTFVELRKSNPTLFKKMVDGRPEMKLLGVPVIPENKDAPAPVLDERSTSNGGELASKIFSS